MALATQSRALAGIRVLDVSQMLAGPQCSMRLGDLGADVIKVEPPQGEWTRSHTIADAYLAGESTPYLGLNRNKRSIVLNLKSKAGLDVFYQLVEKCDVFLQNFRVGTVERLKIGYDTLRTINPRLVYCSISGFGEDGPYRNRPGQDLILQGYSGSLYSVGRKTDPPAPAPFYGPDVMTSYQACIAILAALIARDHTGAGQKIDVSMFATMLDCQQQEILTCINTGLMPPRTDEPLANAWINAPYGIYRTKDDYLTMAMAPLHTLGEALDNDRLREMTAWADGARFRDEVYQIVAQALPSRTTAEWIELFEKYNIWCGPVYDYDKLQRDPHVQATQMIADISHPTIGTYRAPNVPVKMSGTPMSIDRPPPLLGEHTDEVLHEVLDFGPEQIRQFHELSEF